MPPVLRPRRRDSSDNRPPAADDNDIENPGPSVNDPVPPQDGSFGHFTRSPPEYVLHPTFDFRVVRFTLGLANTTSPVSVDTQPVELCFHSDFQVSPLRPISLHFDRSHITMYDEPLLLEAPPPPGVAVELGRVDVLPDDPASLAILDEQVWREVREETARKSTRVAPVRSTPRSVPLVMCPLIGVVLASALISVLISYFQTSSQTPFPVSPVNISLTGQLASVSLAVTLLYPTIFFNPFVNVAIGDGTNTTADPGLPPGKVPTINKCWNVTRKLTAAMLKAISDQEIQRHQASSHGGDDGRIWDEDQWAHAGVRWKDIVEAQRRGLRLSGQASTLWSDIAMHIFYLWVPDINLKLGSVVIAMDFVELTAEDDMFIAKNTISLGSPADSGSPGVAGAALPDAIPGGIRSILDSYDQLTRLDLISSSCKILQDCADPIPSSAPPTQVVHPSCHLYYDSPDAIVQHLEMLAASARRRNLTWADHPPSLDADGKAWLDRTAEYFWPNQTVFPAMFNQVMILAQLKETMEQLLGAAETMERAGAIGCKPRKGFIGKLRHWAQTEEEQSPCDLKEDMEQLKKLLRVHLSRQIRDLVQGMQEVRGICQQLSSFSSLMQSLYSPAGWIVNDQGNTHVQLMQMPHPRDQARELRELKKELEVRIYKMAKDAEAWGWWEAIEEEAEGKR